MKIPRHKSRFIAVATALGLYIVLYITDDETIRKLASVVWPWTNNPAVASVNLFMSFPNSGSRFGLTVLEVATSRTAASFYGKEFVDTDGVSLHRDESQLAYDELPTGPFLTSNLTLQTGGKLLTRTYCGGHCFSHCTCEEYDVSLEDFKAECALAEDADTTRDYIDESIITSTIVMIRNPFDNIVSRFHYEHRLNNGLSFNPHFVPWEENYEKNSAGFKQWCAYVDSVNEFTEQQCFADDPTLLELMDRVPCHSEFYKYVHWYNNAFELIKSVASESITVHYTDFYTHGLAVTDEVVDFLGMESTGTEFDFVIRDYTYYFNREEKLKILDFIEYLASDDVLTELRPYLPRPEG